MEESYGGRNLALVPTKEGHHRNNRSYKEVLKQPTVLAPAQNRGGGDYTDLPASESVRHDEGTTHCSSVERRWWCQA